MIPSRTLSMAIGILALTVVVSIFGLSGTATAGPPEGGVISFEQDTGTGLRGHDESAESRDTLVPRTIVISGGEVTFNIVGATVHQVAVFGPGTTPDDVAAAMDGDDLLARENCARGAARYIDTGLLAGEVELIGALEIPPCEDTDADGEGDGPTTVNVDFSGLDPGKYLVICAFEPHFAGRDMYGWVKVK